MVAHALSNATRRDATNAYNFTLRGIEEQEYSPVETTGVKGATKIQDALLEV